MTAPARDGSVPAPNPWVPAILAGAAAFLRMAGVAVAIGVVGWLAAGRPFGVRLTWKLAGLYVGLFHGAGVAVRAGLPSAAPSTDTPIDLSGLTTVHVTLLLGTILAGAVLWRAGRGVGLRAGGGLGRRIGWGAAIAPTYSILVLIVVLVVRLSFPEAGFTDVRIVPWQAFLGALLLAIGAGAAGAAGIERRNSRAEAWFRSGWRMTVALVVLSFAGFLVVAGVRSDASGAYVRWLARAGAPGAIVAVHHVLLLPNQSFLIAAPAMGSCLRLEGSGSQPTTLCLRTLTVRPGLGQIALPAGAGSAPVSLPEVWLLFLMVPAAATVWGGSAAGAGAGSAREAAVRGAGAGVVFAVAVVVGEVLSTIWITREQSGTIFRLGADLVRTGALACAWGIGGGVLGALLASRRQPAGLAEDPPPATPPSPTSA